jgi:hypothetical protein
VPRHKNNRGMRITGNQNACRENPLPKIAIPMHTSIILIKNLTTEARNAEDGNISKGKTTFFTKFDRDRTTLDDPDKAFAAIPYIVILRYIPKP